jgi:hypothetical protein
VDYKADICFFGNPRQKSEDIGETSKAHKESPMQQSYRRALVQLESFPDQSLDLTGVKSCDKH